MMDNTYKTNRFRMPFFNITGITNTNLTFNIAFALLDGEDEGEYAQALGTLEGFRLQLGIRLPTVAITDFEKGLKNALNAIWPTI